MRTWVVAALLIAMSGSCSSGDRPVNQQPSGAGATAGTSPLGGGGAGSAGGRSTRDGGAGRAITVSGGAGGTSSGGASAGRSGASGASAGRSGAGGMSGAGEAGMSPASGGAGGKAADDPIHDQECVVAQRLDTCCGTWVAVEHGEARTQLCLVEIGEPQPSLQERAHCAPQVCTNVLCPLLDEPPTRVAFKGDGLCMLADECFGPDECTIAYDATACCPCPESMPKSIVELEPCLVPEGMPAPEGCPEPACGLCGLCLPAVAPTCPSSDAYTRCR